MKTAIVVVKLKRMW